MSKATLKELGGVRTPYDLAIMMVNELFRRSYPSEDSRLLDAGCGDGIFIECVLEWCKAHGIKPPKIVGIEIDEERVKQAREKFDVLSNVEILEEDFLLIQEEAIGKFDYVISNPPYVSYEKIPYEKRKVYKKLFKTAVGRYDLYMLFFEKALRVLRSGGRLVFVTPEKYLYVQSASSLRRLLSGFHIEKIIFVDEKIFKGILAYPVVTVINKVKRKEETTVVFRDGRECSVVLSGSDSWLPKIMEASNRSIRGYNEGSYNLKLGDLAIRISAGVATGCDEVFVINKDNLPSDLVPFAYPTVSGSELSKFKNIKIVDYRKLEKVILVPYDQNGNLLGEDKLLPLLNYLKQFKDKLENRYVVRNGKRVWFAFHENPPLKEMLRPKILWRDIERDPVFYADVNGRVIPRHSVYYMVPRDPSIIPKLIKYLNSDEVKHWLRLHCQRAANGYLRLQTHVLKNLPIPDHLVISDEGGGRGS